MLLVGQGSSGAAAAASMHLQDVQLSVIVQVAVPRPGAGTCRRLFISDQVQCLAIVEGRGDGSDHRPLIVDIDIDSNI